MRKVIMIALLALMTLGVSAQEFVVKSGSMTPLFQTDKTVALKIDFSQAKMANLSKDQLTETLMMDYLKEKDTFTYENWQKHADECHEFFRERWNDDKGTPKIIEADANAAADYTISVKFDYIDFGSAAAAVWGFSKKSGGIMMRGTIEFTDANDQAVCTLIVNDYRGMSVRGMDMKLPTFGRRLALFHKSLAKDILVFAKKQGRK